MHVFILRLLQQWNPFANGTRGRRRRQSISVPLATDILERRCLLAATLVEDINTAPAGAFDDSSWPGFFEVNGRVVFAASTPGTGREYWTTDGTEAGTMLLKDILPGSGDGIVGYRPATVIGTRAWFAAYDGTGAGMWSTDGTPNGTTRLPDMIPSSMTNLNGSLLFSASDRTSTTARNRVNLWISDGTEEGTTQVFEPGTAPFSDPFNVITVGDHAFFTAYNNSGGVDLWKTDGTTGGTEVVGSNSDLTYASGTAGGRLYFLVTTSSASSALWTSDGTPGGTLVVHSNVLWPRESPQLPVIGETVYFEAFDEEHGYELWKSDGTVEGTIRVADILPGSRSSSPGRITPVGDKVYFSAYDGVASQLFVSDGTQAGTSVVRSALDGGPSGPDSLVEMDGVLYFSANVNSSSERRIWRSDGTADGTGQVIDVTPGILYGPPTTDIFSIGSQLYFTVEDEVYGRELWASDGTADGTRLVADLVHANRGSMPRDFVIVGDTVSFLANGTDSEIHLLSTKPDATGNDVVSELAAGISFRSTDEVTAFRERIYFSFDPDRSPSGLAYVDPVNQTISTVFESRSSLPLRELTPVDNKLFFIVYTPTDGDQLWVLDGNVGNAALVRDLDPGNEHFTLGDLVAMGDTLYFEADDGVHGRGLWKSDGSFDGTVLVKTLESGQLDVGIQHLTTLGNRLFFSYNWRLWSSDGTSAGTMPITDEFGRGIPVYDLVVAGDRLFLSGWNSPQGDGLLTSDGTYAGTRMVKAIRPKPALVSTFINSVGERVFFAADDGTHGYEMWVSDGTEDGTARLADLFPGIGSSNPSEFTLVGDTVYFAATDEQHGEELFRIPLAETYPVDFGDAPAGYPTTLADDGARHLISGPFLGTARTAEPDGISAESSDQDAGDDGVRPAALLAAGRTVRLQITSSGPGYVSAWADFNRDGDWDDAGELFLSNQAVSEGLNDAVVNVPADLLPGGLVMRYRLTSEAVDSPSSVGLLPDGEVEDYVVNVTPNATLNPVGAVVEAAPESLSWEATPGAVRYEVWFSRVDLNPSRLHHDTQVTSTSWTLPADPGAGMFRYWVRPFDADGHAGPWSYSDTFRVPIALTNSPLSAEARPVFSWTDIPDVTYELYLRTSAGDIVKTELTDSTWVADDDLPDGHVYWWVRASDSSGHRSRWSARSETWVGGMTALLTPTGSVSGRPEFSWLPVTGASP
ncbi:MAG: GEVED domain-containing protein [Planctomycetaceae bacterium]